MKRLELTFSPTDLLNKVKQVMTEDLPTSETSDLVRDIFKNIKDIPTFSKELKDVILSTEVKTINVVLLVSGIVDNTELRDKSMEWRKYMEEHLFEISDYLLKNPKTATLYGSEMGKWIKKKMFVGESLDKLNSLVVEKAPDDKITGQKRKREDATEGDDKILKKQKLD